MELDELAPFVENHFGDTHTLSVPRRTFLDWADTRSVARYAKTSIF